MYIFVQWLVELYIKSCGRSMLLPCLVVGSILYHRLSPPAKNETVRVCFIISRAAYWCKRLHYSIQLHVLLPNNCCSNQGRKRRERLWRDTGFSTIQGGKRCLKRSMLGECFSHWKCGKILSEQTKKMTGKELVVYFCSIQSQPESIMFLQLALYAHRACYFRCTLELSVPDKRWPAKTSTVTQWQNVRLASRKP